MRWLLLLYPGAWRVRYGEEFAAVLASQRISAGLVLDVIGGAIDAHLYPQIQHSQTTETQGGDRMTRSMLLRCAAGGPKLSPTERRTASRFGIFGALGIAILYLVLTKLYHGAPAVQALLYTFICSSFTYEQMVYLRTRQKLTRILIVAGELSAMYVFFVAVLVVANRL
jgi:hypothetical protein